MAARPVGPGRPALFVERAQAAEPRVRWDASDPRVIDLCRRLDNVPLALELAAGQLRRFDLDELARRFDRRRGLPARRGSEGSDRHATIEATIDWSYQLLDAAEQELLRHLSAFPASFDLEAVEASAPPSLTVEADVLLGELVDKSLVVREPGTGRYRLLETIRAFARHRLGEAGEDQDAVETAHRIASRAEVTDLEGACLAAHYRALERLTDPRRAKDRLTPALELARMSRDLRLITLIETFVVVSELAAGEHETAQVRLLGLDSSASEDGYDRFILHWAGWLLGLAETDAQLARRWMDRQHRFLDHTGIVETWITSFSTAMCEVLEGGDVQGHLGRTLALADREGYRADADCLLALAYAEVCAGRFDTALELAAAAAQHGFNATAHYVLYRAVLDHALRRNLDEPAFQAAVERGLRLSAAEALAAQGIARG